ncbi:hypothetical protein ACJX0J_018415, partial [Zea mays]
EGLPSATFMLLIKPLGLTCLAFCFRVFSNTEELCLPLITAYKKSSILKKIVCYLWVG